MMAFFVTIAVTCMSFTDPKRNIEQFMLEKGMDVADFGAGAGFLAVEAAEEVGSDGTVYVIDIQQELLTKATHIAKEHHLDTITFIHGDLEKEQGSTLPDMSVDAVIISNILFQTENKKAVLQEAYRILKDKGKILIVDWKDSFGGVGPQPSSILLEDDAKALAEEVGFTFSSNIDTGAYHYGLICKK
jgi:ubiquinone/menaquinone biosynthesis C-methylase UbiE